VLKHESRVCDRLTLDFVISLSVLHNYTVSHKTRTCDVCS